MVMCGMLASDAHIYGCTKKSRFCLEFNCPGFHREALAASLLRHAESDQHDGEADELKGARHLAQKQESDQQGESRHQRGKHRSAPGAEKDDRAGEKINGAGPPEKALHHRLQEILRKTKGYHVRKTEQEPSAREYRATRAR